MPRIFVWLVIAFAALAGLVVVLIMALVLLVDPNDYRDDIEELVAKRTGHELVIEGEMNLSFFPWLGLDLGRTRLENREGFGDDPFVSIESAGVAVRLLPLLRLEVVLDTVRLEGLRANLIVNEAGEANWDFDLPVDEEEPEVTEEPPVADPDQLPVTIGTIRGVRVTDARMRFEDWQKGIRHEAGPVNIRLGELVLGEDVSLDGDWAVSLGDATRLEGSLEALLRASTDLQRFRARINALDLRTFAEGLPDEGLETSLSALLEADLQRDSASLSELAVRSAGLRLNAAADVLGLTGDLRVNGRFDVPETDLRDVLERLQQDVPETADPDALRRFTMDGVFLASAERAELTELRVDLDGARLSGTGSVGDLADPVIRFDLAGTRFEADRYLPPGTDEEGAGGVAVGEAGEKDPEAAQIPLEPLRALNLDGRFRLEELLIAGFELSEINIQVQAEGGHIRIHPLVARLYGGEYHGDIRLDATGDALAARVNERLSGVQAQPVVQQLLGRDLLRGTAAVRLEGETCGVEVMELVRELVARADLAFTDGDFMGVDLEQTVHSAMARLRDQATEEPEARRTPFRDVMATLSINRGQIANDNLRIRSPMFSIRGVGEAHLFDHTVDYLLNVELVGDGDDGLERLRGVALPLRFEGSLLSPSIGIDLQEALTSEQRQRLREGEAAIRGRVREEEGQAQERLREVRKEREEELRDRARDGLRGLFD